MKGRKGENRRPVLVDALAQILAYTQKNPTAASGGDDGRVLMVAGTLSSSGFGFGLGPPVISCGGTQPTLFALGLFGPIVQRKYFGET